MIHGGKAANHSVSLPSPDLFGSHRQRSRGRTKPTGLFYRLSGNGGGSVSQRSWAAALHRPLCSDPGIKHLPVRKNGINTNELTIPSVASVGHGLCGRGFAQYIQQSCLIPGEAAARYHSINKGQCLGRKTFLVFFFFKSFKGFLLILFVFLLMLSVQARNAYQHCWNIQNSIKNLKSLHTFSFLLISQKGAALPKF